VVKLVEPKILTILSLRGEDLYQMVEISNKLDLLNLIDPKIYISESAYNYFKFFKETQCPAVYQSKIYISECIEWTDWHLECIKRAIEL
jgi:hypothetical protein